MTRFPWGPRGNGVGEEGLPSAPGTRAHGSPEGEVSRPRDFPKGNTEERARVYPWASRTLPTLPATGFLPHLPAASGDPSNPILVPLRHLWLLIDLQRKPHIPESRAFRIHSPTSPPPRVCPGPRMHRVRVASPTSHSSGCRAGARASQPPERSAGRGDCQPPTQSSKPSSNVISCKSSTSPESESLLPLGSVPPPDSTARGAFSDIRAAFRRGPRVSWLLPNPQCLTHRCSKQSLQERLNERVRFLY